MSSFLFKELHNFVTLNASPCSCEVRHHLCSFRKIFLKTDFFVSSTWTHFHIMRLHWYLFPIVLLLTSLQLLTVLFAIFPWTLMLYSRVSAFRQRKRPLCVQSYLSRVRVSLFSHFSYVLHKVLSRGADLG